MIAPPPGGGVLRALIGGLAGAGALASLVLSCAAPAGRAAPGTCTLRGVLRLVPRPGVTPIGKSDGPYGDRRLRDVEPVDYDRPGFAVVWVDGPPAAAERARLALRGTRGGVHFVPARTAVGAGSTIAIANEDGAAHALSCPAAGLLRRIAPGDEVVLPSTAPGAALAIYALDAGGAEAEVFVAPGPFAVVAPTGEFALGGLTPGRRVLHGWHPRFPKASRPVELAPGETVRVDIEIGVGRAE
jgi:hypothetical protein